MKKLIGLLLLTIGFVSCKKDAGEGGFASIEGKVYVKNYDQYFSYITSEYYLPSETVYIIYGTDSEVGNTVKTSYDGYFKFNYLQKGKYRIYVLGKDSNLVSRGNPKESLVEINITQKKQKVVLEDLVILK